MSGSIRLTLRSNADHNSEGKTVVLKEEDKDLSVLTKLAADRLGVKGKKFYLEGVEVDDAKALRDGDILYVSAGEEYYGSKKSASCRTLSVAVMGPGSVGKSAMTLQFVQNMFVADYDPTIEDAYRKTITLEKSDTYVLDILDTAGQEDYIALRSTWMRQRDGFILVYSVTDKTSFEVLEQFYEQLSVMHEEGIPPVILAANKTDCSGRAVSTEEGKKRAEEWGAQYFECSAKTGKNIEAVFTTLARMVRDTTEKKDDGKKTHRWRCAIL